MSPRKPYDMVSFGATFAPLFGVLLAGGILWLILTEGLPDSLGGRISMIATMVAFGLGGGLMSLLFTLERYRFAKTIISQNSHLIFVSKERRIKNNYTGVCKDFIIQNIDRAVLSKLQHTLTSMTTFEPAKLRVKVYPWQINLNRFWDLPKIQIKLQTEVVRYNWNSIHKDVEGLTDGFLCTVKIQDTYTALVGLIQHELSHIFLDHVFHIHGETLHHEIIKAAKLDESFIDF